MFLDNIPILQDFVDTMTNGNVRIIINGMNLKKIPDFRSFGSEINASNMSLTYLEPDFRYEGSKFENKITHLDLSDNKIEKMEGLGNLTNLKYLWLNNNQIKNVEGLENLTNLEHLFLKIIK